MSLGWALDYGFPEPAMATVESSGVIVKGVPSTKNLTIYGYTHD